MNIGVIGQGFVGNAVYQKFKSFFKVYTYDLNTEICNSSYNDLVSNCKVVFVCLPTPMSKDGSCDLGIVKSILSKLNNDTKAIVVNKSTVVPGSTQKFNNLYKNLQVIFNPEFLRERNAVEDFNNQKRIILGGPQICVEELKKIYIKVFPNANIIKTDSISAEMIKYLTNAFLASKVSFANEMYELCSALNLDYKTIIRYASLDERLGTSHWKVPGPDGNFGFGGRCFPKDLSALIKMTEDLGTVNNTLKSVQKTNIKVRKNKISKL